jgi:hypothetical protein
MEIHLPLFGLHHVPPVSVNQTAFVNHSPSIGTSKVRIDISVVYLVLVSKLSLQYRTTAVFEPIPSTLRVLPTRVYGRCTVVPVLRYGAHRYDVGHWSSSVPRSNSNRLSGTGRANVDPVRLLLLRISESYALERLWITISVTEETMTREWLTHLKNQSIQESDTSLLLQLTLRPYWETETSVLRKA